MWINYSYTWDTFFSILKVFMILNEKTYWFLYFLSRLRFEWRKQMQIQFSNPSYKLLTLLFRTIHQIWLALVMTKKVVDKNEFLLNFLWFASAVNRVKMIFLEGVSFWLLKKAHTINVAFTPHLSKWTTCPMLKLKCCKSSWKTFHL